MANPTGESESDAVRLDFDRRLILQFGDGFTEAALPSLNGHLGGISAYKGAQLMSCWSKWHEP